MKFNRKWYHYFAVLLLASLFIIINIYQVDTSLNDEDRKVFEKLFPTVDQEHLNQTFDQEIDVIEKIQQKAFDIAPTNDGIPYRSAREPSDLVKWGKGLCYDRSRFIEKALQYHGLEVRHLAIYKRTQNLPLLTLIRKGIDSHSVTEVKTKKGWLYIDSNDPWISLSKSNSPVSVRKISKKGFFSFHWKDPEAPAILKSKFLYVYGLYSRHGEFYPPYHFFPDISVEEAMGNFIPEID